jgi:hypothetical protein
MNNDRHLRGHDCAPPSAHAGINRRRRARCAQLCVDVRRTRMPRRCEPAQECNPERQRRCERERHAIDCDLVAPWHDRRDKTPESREAEPRDGRTEHASRARDHQALNQQLFRDAQR